MRTMFVAVALLLFAAAGCRMCGSGCYDYLPPVADGPYCNCEGRAGSAFGSYASTNQYEGPLPDPAVEVAEAN